MPSEINASDPLTLWQHDLDPPPILADPHIRHASALMALADKLSAVVNILDTLNNDRAEEREYGLDVANMAAKFAIAVLGYLGRVEDDGPTPTLTNLRMAASALDNLLAVTRGHLNAWQRAAHDDNPAFTTPATSEPSEGGLVIDRPQHTEKITIDRWADLGLGIDEDWRYYAFSPCPELGERVRLKDGVVLPLKGDRWKKVLPCFARSHDGRTADTGELLMELGYYKKGDVVEKQAVFEEGLTTKATTPFRRLSVTMADLGRELRNLVSTMDKTTVFESNGDTYRAAFTTRHLFRDDDGDITFGRVE